MDLANQVHQALARMEDALEKNENRTVFSLFRKDIIKILCGAGVLKVCSPYYYKNGNIKMDKVAGELEGAFQYYYSGNGAAVLCGRMESPSRAGGGQHISWRK